MSYQERAGFYVNDNDVGPRDVTLRWGQRRHLVVIPLAFNTQMCVGENLKSCRIDGSTTLLAHTVSPCPQPAQRIFHHRQMAAVKLKQRPVHRILRHVRSTIRRMVGVGRTRVVLSIQPADFLYQPFAFGFETLSHINLRSEHLLSPLLQDFAWLTQPDEARAATFSSPIMIVPDPRVR